MVIGMLVPPAYLIREVYIFFQYNFEGFNIVAAYSLMKLCSSGT